MAVLQTASPATNTEWRHEPLAWPSSLSPDKVLHAIAEALARVAERQSIAEKRTSAAATKVGDELVKLSLAGAWSMELSGVAREFETLFAAHGEERDRHAKRIQQIADPDSILKVAFASFAEKGNAERLVLAADLLGAYGARGLRSLQKLTRSGARECEYFVDTIATLAQDPSLAGDMKDLLVQWAKHPISSVRHQLSDVLDTLPASLRRHALNALAHEASADIAATAGNVVGHE